MYSSVRHYTVDFLSFSIIISKMKHDDVTQILSKSHLDPLL